jgi:hypothetical protein
MGRRPGVHFGTQVDDWQYISNFDNLIYSNAIIIKKGTDRAVGASVFVPGLQVIFFPAPQ